MTNSPSAVDRPRRGRPEAPPSSQRFVEAALDLFAEHGFTGTSLQMIGDRVGVSKAAVAYHFHSKDDLLAAVVEAAFADLRAVLDAAEHAGRDSARRTRALDGYVDYLIRHRRVSTWLSRDVAALTHPVVVERVADFQTRMDGLILAGDDAQARIWGSALYQALNGAVFSAAGVGNEELREELTRMGRHMIRGFQNAQRRTGPTAGATRASAGVRA